MLSFAAFEYGVLGEGQQSSFKNHKWGEGGASRNANKNYSNAAL